METFFPALLALAAAAVALLYSRKVEYDLLVEYTDINRYAMYTKTDRIEQLFGERLAEKTGLLARRAIVCIERLKEAEAVKEDIARSAVSDFRRWMNNSARDPYRQENDFGFVELHLDWVHSEDPDLFTYWDKLRDEVEEHREFIRVYNRLFGIPKSNGYKVSWTDAVRSNAKF